MGLRQQRADANYFTVDGGSANFGVTGYLPLVQTAGGALPALSASGGTNSLVAVEELCPPQFTHVPFRVFGGAQQRRNLHCECWEYEQGKQGTDEQRQVNLIDNLSVVKRSHELKFGVDYRRLPPFSRPEVYAQFAEFAGVTTCIAQPCTKTPGDTLSDMAQAAWGFNQVP